MRNNSLLKKVKENLSLIVLLVVVLGYAVQGVGFFSRVPALEKKVDTYEKKVDSYEREIADLKGEINTLKITINKVHERAKSIETTTNQISEYLIQKALDK